MKYRLVSYTENLNTPAIGDVIQVAKKNWIVFDGEEWSRMDFFESFQFSKQMESENGKAN